MNEFFFVIVALMSHGFVFSYFLLRFYFTIFFGCTVDTSNGTVICLNYFGWLAPLRGKALRRTAKTFTFFLESVYLYILG